MLLDIAAESAVPSPLCRTDALRAVAQRLHAKRRSLRVSTLIYRHSYGSCSAVTLAVLPCVVSVLINRLQMIPQRLRINNMAPR